MSKFKEDVYQITNGLAELLIDKNKKYGNSALEPVRVFSKASATEQLLVRLDDKLSRLRTQSIDEDEDVLEDLLGYLILLKLSLAKSKPDDYRNHMKIGNVDIDKYYVFNNDWKQQLRYCNHHELIPLLDVDKVDDYVDSKYVGTPDEDGMVQVDGLSYKIPFSILKEVT